MKGALGSAQAETGCSGQSRNADTDLQTWPTEERLEVTFDNALQGSVIGIYTGWAMRELDPRWIDRKDDLALNKFAPERWLTEEGKNQVRANMSACRSNDKS